MEVPSIYLNRILINATKIGANSVHLSVGAPPIVRINGELKSLESEGILSAENLEKIIHSFASEKDLEKLKQNKQIVLIKELSGNFRFRINIFYQKNLISISFNYISNKIKTWSELNLPQIIKDLIDYQSGLLIVSGPNDSGKTTTVAAILQEINSQRKKYIITLEDPIEYIFLSQRSIIEQREIGQDVDSFVSGLKYCLKEDVDLVYVSLIPDQEFGDALPLILELAAGNALVIMEINAENYIRALEKILNVKQINLSTEALRYNLADSLLAVISQRLIPGRGGDLVLANEVLTLSSPVQSLIREGKIYQLESIIQTSRGEGMISMKKSIQELINADKIHLETARKLKLI